MNSLFFRQAWKGLLKRALLVSSVLLGLIYAPQGAWSHPEVSCDTDWGLSWMTPMDVRKGTQVVCHTCVNGFIPEGGLGTCGAGDPFTDVVEGRPFIGNNVVWAGESCEQIRNDFVNKVDVRWCFDLGTPQENCVQYDARDVEGPCNTLNMFYGGSQNYPGGIPFSDEDMRQVYLVGFYPEHRIKNSGSSNASLGYHSIDIFFANRTGETIVSPFPDFLPDVPAHGEAYSFADHTCVNIVSKN